MANKILHILFHSCIGLILSVIHVGDEEISLSIETPQLSFFLFSLFSFQILHISKLFENQSKFSHLSSLERELSLGPHEAFFYHFYKRLIEAKSMEIGLQDLTSDNLTEFNEGMTVNSLRRFHIMPEVIIAFLYRNFMLLSAYFNIPIINCFYVEPDENSKIDDAKVFINCEGLGEPIFFYLAIVWSLSAITIFLLYMYAYFLHRSFFAGCAAIVYYFCSHEIATNIHRTPMSRQLIVHLHAAAIH